MGDAASSGMLLRDMLKISKTVSRGQQCSKPTAESSVRSPLKRSFGDVWYLNGQAGSSYNATQAGHCIVKRRKFDTAAWVMEVFRRPRVNDDELMAADLTVNLATTSGSHKWAQVETTTAGSSSTGVAQVNIILPAYIRGVMNAGTRKLRNRRLEDLLTAEKLERRAEDWQAYLVHVTEEFESRKEVPTMECRSDRQRWTLKEEIINAIGSVRQRRLTITEIAEYLVFRNDAHRMRQLSDLRKLICSELWRHDCFYNYDDDGVLWTFDEEMVE